jgi:cyclopropane fatty-acyl-phospholipid synthase-like methyltransferase
MLNRLRQMLADPRIYIALQKAVGADRVRDHCLDVAELKPGERVLDVGCGPAYYIGRLPEVDYVGFDTSASYVTHARQRYGDRGEFRCEFLTADHLSELGQFDAVLLFGVLHHLSDVECAILLDLSARALTPSGRVVSCDPTVHRNQHWLSRWMAENDRGKYVRRPESYSKMAKAPFNDVETEILDSVGRVPNSQYIMRMSVPLMHHPSGVHQDDKSQPISPG